MTIALIGDSTVTATSGWGGAFADRASPGVTVLNFAVGGRSSKSWHDEQRLPDALSAKPDVVLIQFGHNDQPGKGPERETDPATSFREFLRLYVTAFREIGATVVILSSVTRRTFGEDGRIASTLTPWAEAAGAVAREMKVPFIDLHALSIDHHEAIGHEASMGYNLTPGDTTHFNPTGAAAIADLVVTECQRVVPALATALQ